MLVKPVNTNSYNRQGPADYPAHMSDVSIAQKKKKFPDRNLHHISHNVVFNGYSNGQEEQQNYPPEDSRNKNNFSQFNSAPIEQPRQQQSSLMNKVSFY